MKRDYYSSSIQQFLESSSNEIFGIIDQAHTLSSEPTQKGAWVEEIRMLKEVLREFKGRIYFEYAIPRMGKRIDTVLLIGSALFVLEFKIGEDRFTSHAINQVYDYAVDLKNFHETSRDVLIAPIVIATNATTPEPSISATVHNDDVLVPMRSTVQLLAPTIKRVLEYRRTKDIDPDRWETGRYSPTPTIIEAAMALYNYHSVDEISRSDAAAINLTTTSAAISEIIQTAQSTPFKAVCFVTGVPGAGKTLVGLNIATERRNESDTLYSVFLSGNKPLVDILREALTRDRVRRNQLANQKKTKGQVMSEVKAFIQNVHHFRDECIIDPGPPFDHVALFDEAQRAWDFEKTANFMRRKKNQPDFKQSEPEYLISCLDRHPDWAVVVCLVGGGQEINTGEAGISEWIDSLNRSFPDWHVYISSRLSDTEYAAGRALESLASRRKVTILDDLHLGVSMRSFRAENVSLLVKQLLDLETQQATSTLANISEKYPIVLTRNLAKAKSWLRQQARGTERYGIVASSWAERLKPLAINVKYTIDPTLWFLNRSEDVRSSFYLEDVATQFDVQGLELDWVCVAWDADFRYTPQGWEHKKFVGEGWNRINKPERKLYQKNAYRVLLTRARQGMVIVVPEGDPHDPTRKPEYYDPTFNYLHDIGFPIL